MRRVADLINLFLEALASLTALASRRLFRWLFFPMVAIASLLIGIHIWLGYIVADPEFTIWHRANIGRDRGYGERFEYILLALAAGALGLEYLRTRSAIYMLGAVTCGYLLLDNMFMIHEEVGLFLAVNVTFVTERYFGELVPLLAMGLLFAGGCLLCLAHGRPSDNVRALGVLVLILPLALFGVVIDNIHSLLEHRPTLDGVLILVEDGGEMVVLCALSAAALAIAIEPRISPFARPIVSAVSRWRAGDPSLPR